MAVVWNPTQPLPVVLASDLCPPPFWPVPHGNQISLPVVAVGAPAGPFTPIYSGPVGDGTYPGPSFCPGSGLVVQPPEEPPEPPVTTAFQVGGPSLARRRSHDRP
jgi:hypothetical protein